MLMMIIITIILIVLGLAGQEKVEQVSEGLSSVSK